MKLDWDRGHGPITGPINASGGALVTSWAGHAAHVPPFWAALVAGGGLVGTYLNGRLRRVTRAHQAVRAAGWLAAGTWSSIAVANGPWTHAGIGSLIGVTVALGVAMTGAKHADEKAVEEAARAKAAERRAALDGRRLEIAQEWEERIARVAHDLSVEVVGVDFWPEDAGFSLDVEMPAGGAKWKDLAAHVDGLASDARLPEGCGVEVGPGAHRGAALVHIATVNALIGDVAYPDDYSPLSVNGPAPLGIHRDRTTFAPATRQRSGLTVGQKGTGKTNLMNVKIANQLRMVDALPWIIDLNGGGLALAWLHAWERAGRPGHPPIDWVADTPAKALALSQALVRIALARKPGYKHLEIEANDDKLPVTPQVPAIVCDNDEIAELFSPRARRDPILREVGDNLVRVQELGRAAATNVENAALRATQDVISEPQILKQSALRIGLRCDESELAYLFGWNDRLSPEDAPYPGCGFYKVDQEPARPFKVYRLTPNQILDIVTATADRHPQLDDLSRQAAGEAYERRWEGTDHLFGLAPTPAPAATQAEPRPTAPERGIGQGVTSSWTTDPAPKAEPGRDLVGGDARAPLNDAAAASDKLRAAMDDATIRDPDLDAQFRDTLRGGGIDWERGPSTAPPAADVSPAGAKDDDPRKEMIFSIVQKAGADGIGPEAIRDIFVQVFGAHGYNAPHAATIGRWLSADPRVHKPGGYGRYAVRPEQTGE